MIYEAQDGMDQHTLFDSDGDRGQVGTLAAVGRRAICKDDRRAHHAPLALRHGWVLCGELAQLHGLGEHGGAL